MHVLRPSVERNCSQELTSGIAVSVKSKEIFIRNLNYLNYQEY